MTAFVALLRAVNVGGTGKLPMEDLRALCVAAGFDRVRTYIASGNVLFDSDREEPAVKAALESSLRAYAGKPVGVLVRTAAEMAAVVDANPFSDRPGNRTMAFFLDGPPSADLLAGVTGRNGEAIASGLREIYVAYDDGMGNSKLKIPAAASGLFNADQIAV